MYIKIIIFIAILISSLSLYSPAHASSLCSKRETTFFSCKIKGSKKMASLCGDISSSSKAIDEVKFNWLQYRFGKKSKVEFIFPKEKQNSVKNFRSSNLGHASKSERKVFFSDNDKEYSLEQYISHPNNEIDIRVVVNNIKNKQLTFNCERVLQEEINRFDDLTFNYLENDYN